MRLFHTYRHVKSMEYSVIVFDTAPTGHTLRFLSFPTVLEKALGKLSTLGSRFGPMISQMSSMMGGEAASQEDMFAKLEGMRSVITEVNNQFKDPVRFPISPSQQHILTYWTDATGKNYICLCLHLRVLVTVRDRTSGSRTDKL